MTSESCQSLIEKAISQGSQTHAADQLGGIYILRPQSKNIATISHHASNDHALDDLYTGYTRPVLN